MFLKYFAFMILFSLYNNVDYTQNRFDFCFAVK